MKFDYVWDIICEKKLIRLGRLQKSLSLVCMMMMMMKTIETSQKCFFYYVNQVAKLVGHMCHIQER